MTSPVLHSTEYRTHLERVRHGGFQTLDVEHRTKADTLWTNHLALRRRQTTTEIDGDGRRRRQMKTDEDGDRRRRRETKTETGEGGNKTKTEIDGDRRRRRQTTTETGEDGDSHSGDERIGSSLTADNIQSDEDGDRRIRRRAKAKTRRRRRRAKAQTRRRRG